MKRTVLLIGSMLLSGLTFAKDLPTVEVLKTTFAQQIAKTAYTNCVEQGFTPSVSIVDQQGTLIYFQRGEDTGPHSAKTSFRKAYTAASLKMPTSTLAVFVDMPKFSQLAKMGDDILLLPGGLPITNNGAVIGGIGMSGAPSPEQEEKCAADALATEFN
ncbi:GlcG/HbpS family heme-binding protein [Neptunomonas japonica]|uniref:GlcG/HbpS family heme-binding protein n=1 Tax=Neptunomonas japonica TaxID=417574 RepID=UPI000406D30F|nr:heme-binding protein [Neptunomonas japonica]